MVEDSRASGVPTLSLEGGDAFFKEPVIPAELAVQWREKADIVAQAYGRALDVFVPGELDVVDGVPAFLLRTQQAHVSVLAANLVDAKGVAPFPGSVLKDVGGLKVLVVGVVDPALWPANPVLQAGDPVAAIKAVMATAPAHDVAVLVAHAAPETVAPWSKAVPLFSLVLTSHTGQLFFQPKTLANDPGSPVVEALTFASSKAGKYVARAQVVHHAGERTFVGGETRSRLVFGLQELEKKLAQTPDHPRTQAEVAESKALLAAQDAHSHVDFSIVGFESALPEDAAVAALAAAYNTRNAAREAEYLEKTTPPPTEIPTSSPYAGANACKACHVEQYNVWLKSDHSHAMASLRKTKQELDRECVACHSIGYQKPGGYQDPARMGPFGDVQCEACHDAARAHLEGGAKPSRAVGEAVCRRCHTPDATPQFNFVKDRLRIKHWNGP